MRGIASSALALPWADRNSIVMAAAPALEVNNLRVGRISASFEIAVGECVALQGASGSGKSLLLRALADLDQAVGEVRSDGISREAVPAPAWRRRVCYVAAEPGWWGETVADHFADWSAISHRTVELGLPIGCGKWPVRRLSTGERQRLAVLRAISVGPRTLLLDEPTSALDRSATAALERLIAAERRNGMAVLWVTHSTGQAKRVASRLLLIEGQELREVVW